MKDPMATPAEEERAITWKLEHERYRPSGNWDLHTDYDQRTLPLLSLPGSCTAGSSFKSFSGRLATVISIPVCIYCVLVTTVASTGRIAPMHGSCGH